MYEFNVENNHVMRRRLDGWINATQILKVADFDKPARTRILEREVQKGIHEKVQGGYGKYQGWRSKVLLLLRKSDRWYRNLDPLRIGAATRREKRCLREAEAHF